MEHATVVIIGIGVILIGILIVAHILHNNINERELKEFEERLSKAKYATCEYVYTDPFIPMLKDIYIVKEVKKSKLSRNTRKYKQDLYKNGRISENDKTASERRD